MLSSVAQQIYGENADKSDWYELLNDWDASVRRCEHDEDLGQENPNSDPRPLDDRATVLLFPQR